MFACVCMCVRDHYFITTSGHRYTDSFKSLCGSTSYTSNGVQVLGRIAQTKGNHKSQRRIEKEWMMMIGMLKLATVMGHTRDGRWADLIELIQWPSGCQFKIVQRFE